MPDPVGNIPGVRPPQRVDPGPLPLRTAKPSGPAEGGSFKDLLSEAVTEVQHLQTQADTAVKDLVTGKVKDVTDAMVAVEKADIAFQTMMAVRNKMVAAYEEIMRMNV